MKGHPYQVWQVVWDGEPAMGGGYHVMSLGTEFLSQEHAERAIQNAGRLRHHPNVRLRTRFVTEWEETKNADD